MPFCWTWCTMISSEFELVYDRHNFKGLCEFVKGCSMLPWPFQGAKSSLIHAAFWCNADGQLSLSAPHSHSSQLTLLLCKNKMRLRDWRCVTTWSNDGTCGTMMQFCVLFFQAKYIYGMSMCLQHRSDGEKRGTCSFTETWIATKSHRSNSETRIPEPCGDV